VTRVFGYLGWCSARNRLARQVRQLRNPRYALALVLGGGYLAWVLLGQRRDAAPLPIAPDRLELAGALLVLGAVLWSWVFGLERRVLAFSPAEVTFLFPAPIRRRDLIQFKLLRSQLLVLFNSVLWTILLTTGHGASPWRRMFAIWVLLSTLTLHRLGASFVRTTLAEHGVSGARHRILSLALLGVVAIGLTWSAADALPDVAVAARDGLGDGIGALADASRRPLAAAILLPFRMLVRPLVASTASAWLAAIGPALGLLVLHYVWVIRSDAAFEEAAVEASLRRAAALAGGSGTTPARRQHTRVPSPVFPLRRLGRPATAITWKNTVALLRTRRASTTVVALAVFAVGVAVTSAYVATGLDEVVGVLAGMWAALLVVIGPQWVRNDLRNDLRKLELLRTYPVPGRAIVAAEVAASTFALTVLQLALLLVSWVAFLGPAGRDLVLFGAPVDLEARTAILATAVLALPGVNFVGLLIHNGAALLFPAWVHLGTGRPGGVEALGQNLLTVIAFVILLAAALLVPAALAAAVLVACRGLGIWAAVPAAAVLTLGAATESAAALRWLGRVFERTDVTAAGLEAQV
jgi:hypothetical protein